MAKITIETLVDDLDSNVKDDVETVTFHIEGQEYRIDLGVENRQRLADTLKLLEESLSPFIRASRPVHKLPTAPRSKAGRPRTGADSSKVRTWAVANGIEVSARGRVSASVVEKYLAAQRLPVTGLNEQTAVAS